MIKNVCSLQECVTAGLFEILRACSLMFISANQADSAVTAPLPAASQVLLRHNLHLASLKRSAWQLSVRSENVYRTCKGIE